MMTMILRNSVLALALVASAAPIAAQTGAPPVGTPPDAGAAGVGAGPRGDVLKPDQPLKLSAEQKSVVLRAVQQDNRKITPANIAAQVGAQLPPSLELYVMPEGAVAGVPATKPYKYTILQDQKVVLVDPTTMRIAEVIGQ